MKEVTEWDNNPRMMWVWDDATAHKKRVKVVYLCDVDEVRYPVVALSEGITEGSISVNVFKHCAEIEEPKKRRMTNQELAWWLQDEKHREYTNVSTNYIGHEFQYKEISENEPCHPNYRIRENGGEWHEPLVEV